MEILFFSGFLGAIVCAILSAWIASTKKRSGCAWFLIGLILGPIAIILAAVMSRTHSGWVCEYCKEEVQRDAVVCPHCRRELRPPPVTPHQPRVWNWILAALITLLVLGLIYSCVVLARKKSNEVAAPEASKQSQQIAKPDKFEWRVVGSFGVVKTVYITPEAIKDKEFIEQVLRFLLNKTEITEVMFFDSEQNTPRRLPMSDRQMLHWKATYNFNPNTKFERFVFIKITDPKSSPPKLQEIESDIRP